MNKKGLTIVEMLVAIVILGVLFLTINLLIKTGLKTFVDVTKTTSLLQEGEKSLYGSAPQKGVLWEIRLSSAVAGTQAEKLVLVSTGNEYIEYYKSDSNLIRKDSLYTDVIAGEIESVLFKYYKKDAGGLISQTTDYSLVNMVLVELSFNKKGKQRKFLSTAYLRNK